MAEFSEPEGFNQEEWKQDENTPEDMTDAALAEQAKILRERAPRQEGFDYEREMYVEAEKAYQKLEILDQAKRNLEVFLNNNQVFRGENCSNVFDRLTRAYNEKRQENHGYIPEEAVVKAMEEFLDSPFLVNDPEQRPTVNDFIEFMDHIGEGLRGSVKTLEVPDWRDNQRGAEFSEMVLQEAQVLKQELQTYSLARSQLKLMLEQNEIFGSNDSNVFLDNLKSIVRNRGERKGFTELEAAVYEGISDFVQEAMLENIPPDQRTINNALQFLQNKISYLEGGLKVYKEI